MLRDAVGALHTFTRFDQNCGDFSLCCHLRNCIDKFCCRCPLCTAGEPHALDNRAAFAFIHHFERSNFSSSDMEVSSEFTAIGALLPSHDVNKLEDAFPRPPCSTFKRCGSGHIDRSM